MKMLWTAQTTNRKTGNIPSAVIGTHWKDTEKSCGDCPQFGNAALGIPRTCYAYNGMVNMGTKAIQKGYRKSRGRKYSLLQALAKRNKEAKSVRIGVLGEPSAVGLRSYMKAVNLVRKKGLAVLSYTHQWRKLTSPLWKKNIMASCDKLSEVDIAAAAGWRATVILPTNFGGKRTQTIGGQTVIVCPAIYTAKLNLPKEQQTTCNSCRLCDAARPGPHIGFPAHGPSFRNAKKLPMIK